MAQPARSSRSLHEVPFADPLAVRRAYRLERARRRARVERMQERRLATLRFFIVLITLLAGTLFLSLTIWGQIARMFGL